MRKYFIILILLVCSLFAYGQSEPGNNLGSSLASMRQKFPELRYLKTDEKGEEYEDGYPTDGIASFFYFRNGRVVEECMICQATDGFPYQWYLSLCNSFSRSYYRALKVNKRFYKQYVFSSFNINIIFASENGVNTALIQYETN